MNFHFPDAVQKLSVENIKELTGFNVNMKYDIVYDGKFKPIGEHQISKSLKGNTEYGGYHYITNKNNYQFIVILQKC